MGRWSYSSRWTVENCPSISTQFLKKHHYLDSGIRWGLISWKQNTKKSDSIGLVVSILEGDEYIRFLYTQTDNSSQENIKFDYKTKLVWTPCHFGGRRWWFTCPMVTNNSVCGQRVGALYLTDNQHFGCRKCHNLTYRSCKENHALDGIFDALGLSNKEGRQLLKTGELPTQ